MGFFLISTSGKAQREFSGEPLSFSYPLTEVEIPTQTVIAPTEEELHLIEEKNPMRTPNGKLLPVGLTFSDGYTEKTSDNQLIWRLSIQSKEAKALGLYFSSFEIPEGGKVFVYNQFGQQVLGAFTQASNPHHEEFAIRYLVGEELTLEYNGPTGEVPQLDLSHVGYFYRDIPEAKQKHARDFGNSQACQVNVNCDEGVGREDIRDATVRILVLDGGSTFWCSGTVVNNTGGGCVPYLLSADHCAATATSSNFNQFIFYFNYQSPDCDNPTSDAGFNNQTLTGCAKKAQSTTQGDQDSDFLLVELNDTIPTFYNTYYAGWDIRGNSSSNGVSVHHPSGDIKKVSTYSTNLISDSWQGITNHTHWRVVWTGTSNGHGVTEGGSSGSGIFDSENRLIGTLTGGSSSCSGTSFPDYYGKFYHSWSQVGTAANRRLDVWLDPMGWDTTGQLILNGTRFPCEVTTSIASRKAQPDKLFQVIQNPAPQGTIQLQNARVGAEVSVLNGLGQEVYRGAILDESLQVTGLTLGWYVIKVWEEQAQQVERIMVME